MPKPRLAQRVAAYMPAFMEKSVWPSAGVPPPGSQRAGTGRHPVNLSGWNQHSNCADALGPPGEQPGHQKAVEEGTSEAHDIWDRLLLPVCPLLWRVRAC